MSRSRKPSVFQIGKVRDDGRTVVISGWGLGLCAAGCACHRHPSAGHLAIAEDQAGRQPRPRQLQRRRLRLLRAVDRRRARRVLRDFQLLDEPRRPGAPRRLSAGPPDQPRRAPRPTTPVGRPRTPAGRLVVALIRRISLIADTRATCAGGTAASSWDGCDAGADRRLCPARRPHLSTPVPYRRVPTRSTDAASRGAGAPRFRRRGPTVQLARTTTRRRSRAALAWRRSRWRRRRDPLAVLRHRGAWPLRPPRRRPPPRPPRWPRPRPAAHRHRRAGARRPS